MSKKLAVAAVLLGISACSSEVKINPATEILIAVNTDDELRDQIVEVEARTSDRDGIERGESKTFALTNELRFPLSFAVVPPKGRVEGSFLVVVSAKDADGAVLAEAKAFADFVAGKKVAIDLWLMSVCRGVTCDTLETCGAPGSVSGTCGPIPTPDSREIKPGEELDMDRAPSLISPPEHSTAGMDSSTHPAEEAGSADAAPSLGTSPDAGDAGLVEDAAQLDAGELDAGIDAAEAPGADDANIAPDADDANIAPDADDAALQADAEAGTPDSGPACVATFGQPCGSCGGTVTCAGQCSVATPANFGTNCGSCGGRISCSGACSLDTPGNLGAACGSCGGKVTCSGACSIATPSNYNASCGSCGGTVTCSGACSVSTPSSYNTACGSCGGRITCSGGCSVSTPSNFGAACGSCGGTVTCSGGCSKATPTNLGETRIRVDATESFTCCSIDYRKSFGGGCSSGWAYAGYEVRPNAPGIFGGGHCDADSTGPASCQLNMHFYNQNTDGRTCQILIYEKRVCD